MICDCSWTHRTPTSLYAVGSSRPVDDGKKVSALTSGLALIGPVRLSRLGTRDSLKMVEDIRLYGSNVVVHGVLAFHIFLPYSCSTYWLVFDHFSSTYYLGRRCRKVAITIRTLWSKVHCCKGWNWNLAGITSYHTILPDSNYQSWTGFRNNCPEDCIGDIVLNSQRLYR